MFSFNTFSAFFVSDKEKTYRHGSLPAHSSHESSLDPTLERVWRRIDFFIIPNLAMYSLLGLIDQSSIANARVAGLQEDLMLSDHQYTVALTFSYVFVIVSQAAVSLLLKAVGPNIMLPAMATLWGVVATFQGFVRGYSGLLACRFLLGFFEGSSIATITLYLSFWYPRRRLQSRISLLLLISSLAGAFSGLLSYAIIRMDGLGGRPGWAWIFILEGLFSVLFGLSTFFTLPHSPARARFLADTEKKYVISRLRDSGAISHDDDTDAFAWSQAGQTFTHPQVWMFILMNFFAGAVLSAVVSFTPSIVAGLGYTRAQAQLFSVPPIAVGTFVATIAAYLSDYFGARGLNMLCSLALLIIGFVIFLVSQPLNVKYGSLFLIVPGSYSMASALLVWLANNVAPYTRRATAIAIATLSNGCGGIFAVWLLGSLSPPPLYQKATITLLAFSVSTFIISGINLAYLRSQNQKKSAIRVTMSRENESSGLGDRSAWFVYSL